MSSKKGLLTPSSTWDRSSRCMPPMPTTTTMLWRWCRYVTHECVRGVLHGAHMYVHTYDSCLKHLTYYQVAMAAWVLPYGHLHQCGLTSLLTAVHAWLHNFPTSDILVVLGFSAYHKNEVVALVTHVITHTCCHPHTPPSLFLCRHGRGEVRIFTVSN